MSLHSNRLKSKFTGWLMTVSILSACGTAPETVNENTATLEATAETAQFVQSYQASRAIRALANKGVPLQMSARVGPSSDANVCETGQLYGPFTVTDGALEGEQAVATADQPTLRLANLGDLAVCMIVTSPVNATLDMTASALSLDSSECSQTPDYIGGVWQGDYSCNSSCGNENGNVRLTLLQDEYGASYTDGSARYEGTVCGNTFEYSGGGPGYTESGTFTLNADGSASKTSSYKDNDGVCSGSCSDPILVRVSSSRLFDDFDDETHDPAWILSAENSANGTAGWNYIETGTQLVVTDVIPQVIHDESGMQYSRLNLTRDFSALTDFIVEFSINWESDDDSAMQLLNAQLFTHDNSARIAFAGYSDAWVGSSGQQSAGIGSSLFASGLDTLPNTGSASIKIVREENNVSILWDGVEIQQGTASGDLGIIFISFGHYPYDNRLGSVSSFGTISLDKIRISGIPAT